MRTAPRLVTPVAEPTPFELRTSTAKTFGRCAITWWNMRWPLAVIMTCTLGAYTALALLLNSHFLTFGYDLGIYYEALRGYAHFGLPIVNLRGVNFDLLGDHFEPLLAILVPTYWIWPHPDVLLIDQTIMVSLSVIPVWLFAERRFGAARGLQRVTTSCFVTAYALSWEIQSLIGFDFHSLAFSVPIIAAGIERADAGRWRSATLWILLLLFVKEDLSLVVAAFGLFAILKGRRYLGLALVVVGTATFGVLVDLVIPALGTGIYVHWSYGELGNNPSSALRFVLLHPFATLRTMVNPRDKLILLGTIFLPTGFLSLISPILVLAAPEILERILSNRPNLWTTHFQYSAPLAPIIALAVIDGTYKLVKWRYRHICNKDKTSLSTPTDQSQRVSLDSEVDRHIPSIELTARISLALLTVAMILTIKFPLSEFLDNNFLLLRADQSVAAVNTAETLIPRGAMVAASDNLVPPLLNRFNPIVMTPDSVCGSWALVDTAIWLYPYQSTHALKIQVRVMTQNGWKVVYGRANIELLHHVGNRTAASIVCRRNDPLLAPQ